MARAELKIEWDYAAFNALRQSEPVLMDITTRAQAIADAAGEGMYVLADVKATRAVATVITGTEAAKEAEAEEKALTRAIDAGR